MFKGGALWQPPAMNPFGQQTFAAASSATHSAILASASNSNVHNPPANDLTMKKNLLLEQLLKDSNREEKEEKEKKALSDRLAKTDWFWERMSIFSFNPEKKELKLLRISILFSKIFIYDFAKHFKLCYCFKENVWFLSCRKTVGLLKLAMFCIILKMGAGSIILDLNR